MLKTVEAIVEPDGTVRVLEPLRVEVATKAIVTLLVPDSLEDRDVPDRLFPIPELVGKVKITGDIVSPLVVEEDWECLK
jgi:hypothetical protein